MKRAFIAASFIVTMALASGARAASITGVINFSSAPGGGVRLQNAGGILTNNLLEAAGIQEWLLPQVDVRSGSFVTVSQGAAVSMPNAWVFNPSTPLSPLWSIPGPDNFAFYLSSATIEFQSALLLISGTGTLTANGYDPTPAMWFFSTLGLSIRDKYSWSSSIKAVPECGTPALIGAALLGACFLRRRNPASSPPPKKTNMKHASSPVMCLIALLAMTLVSQAGYISGSVDFSSGYGGGVVLQDSAGNVTTNLADAAGIKEWSISEVEEVSGSFDAVTYGTSVSLLQPWLFDPLSPAAPLWKIDGPENFTFHLTSSTMMYQSPYFLAVRANGFLSGDGYQDTPAEWWFTTQGSAVENKFTWSSSAISVPDGGSTVILLGGSLLGLFGVRRWFKRAAHAASHAA